MPRHIQRSMTWLESASIPEPNSGCWLWLGAMQSSGYGHTKIPRSRKSTGAHRLAYTLFVGPIPEGMDVCHKCDTKLCVNPAHLFVGTRKENLHDCIAKGRNSRGVARSLMFSGDASHRAKLSWPQVREIRAAHENGAEPKSLAALFGVSVANIRMILRNETWKHDSQPKEIAA